MTEWVDTYLLLLVVPLSCGHQQVNNFLFTTAKGFFSLLGFSSLLAIYGVMQVANGVYPEVELVMFLAPLFQTIFLGSLMTIFRKFRGHPPRNVLFNSQDGFFWDRCYFMAGMLVSISAPVFIIEQVWGFSAYGT